MPDNSNVIRHFISLLPARIAGRREKGSGAKNIISLGEFLGSGFGVCAT